MSPPAAALKLRRALAQPRHIFVSAAAGAKHRVMVELAGRACALAAPGSRWTWYFEGEDEERKALFLARARRRGRAHQVEMVSLVTPAQLHDAAYGAFPNRMTMAAWLARVCKVDASLSHMGHCAR